MIDIDDLRGRLDRWGRAHWHRDGKISNPIARLYRAPHPTPPPEEVAHGWTPEVAETESWLAALMQGRLDGRHRINGIRARYIGRATVADQARAMGVRRQTYTAWVDETERYVLDIANRRQQVPAGDAKITVALGQDMS